MLQNGTPPNEVEAEEVFNGVPPGRRVEDKLPTGVFDSGGTSTIESNSNGGSD